LDGVTGAIQDHLRMIQKTSALHMMYSVNVYAQLYLFIGLILSGEGLDAVAFVNRHPSLIFYFLLFGLSSALGQLFIFTTITKFGPLTCAIITTTRKFFTILSSVIIFGNTLITRQWIAIVLVFTGLGIDAYFGRKKKSLSSQTQTA
jgi:drug/metabolite transporter (DMT)-like permease